MEFVDGGHCPPYKSCVTSKVARLISLEDRACLGLGMRLGLPVLSADQIWIRVNLSIQITTIR
jgi:PIN domain nuclease of toxin-antitoxin system